MNQDTEKPDYWLLLLVIVGVVGGVFLPKAIPTMPEWLYAITGLGGLSMAILVYVLVFGVPEESHA